MTDFAGNLVLLAQRVAAVIKPLTARVTAIEGYQGAVTDATTARTLSDSDHQKVIEFSSSSAIAVTAPVGLRSNFTTTLVAAGAGLITVGAGSGATVVASGALVKSNGQHAVMGLYQTATANTYRLFGDRA